MSSIEQPPKAMPTEQIPLDFDDQTTGEVPSEIASMTQGADLSQLSDGELNTLYKKTVGVDPTMRFFDRKTIINGIENPTRERDRLYTIDRDEDRAPRRPGYHNS